MSSLNVYLYCSELVTPFQWDVQDPFTIEPSSGVLQPHSSIRVTAYFRPSVSLYLSYFFCLLPNIKSIFTFHSNIYVSVI